MIQKIEDFNSVVPGYSTSETEKISQEGNPSWIYSGVFMIYVYLFCSGVLMIYLLK
jgi:hypothetical protein